MSGFTTADINDAGDLFTNVVYGALMEAGRPDLAVSVVVHRNDDGTPYIETTDRHWPRDWAAIDKAERLGLAALAQRDAKVRH